MVELSTEVAEVLEETYGEEVVRKYESLFPRDVLNSSYTAYTQLDELSGDMTPVEMKKTYDEEGLEHTVEEIDRLGREWRREALAFVMGFAYDDQMGEVRLE